MEAHSREAIAKEMVCKGDLDFFCQLLSKNNLPFLIWKGSALAYDHYSDPLLRPRVDTDVLISEKYRASVFALLKANGYQPQVNQHELLGQVSFIKQINNLLVIYDVHWQVFAQQNLKSLFTFDELWTRRKRLAQMPADTVCDEMALVLSSVHWVAHHYSYPEPHWIVDLQLLSANRSASWWQNVKQICEDKNIRCIVHGTLLRAQVESPWQDETLPIEPLQYLLCPVRTPLSDFSHDWRRMDWSERFRTVFIHLFPNAEYVREKYQIKHSWVLPLFYLFRILNGLKKNLKLR